MVMATKEKPKKIESAKAPEPTGNTPRLICNRDELLARVEFCASVCKGRTPKPILGAILISAEKSRATLRASDMACWLSAVASQVQVERMGTTAVTALTLLEVLRKIPDETITLDCNGTMLTVKGENSKFDLYTQNADEMPAPPKPTDEVKFDLDFTAYVEAAKRVLPAVSDGLNYPKGMLHETKGGKLALVSTDGRRMFFDSLPIKQKEAVASLVPADALRRFVALDVEGDISVALAPGHATFKSDDYAICTNLLEGKFPPHEDVIPKDPNRTFAVGRDELMTAIDQAQVLTTEDSRGSRLNISKKLMVVSSRSAGAGEATINVAGKLDGEPIEIGINGQFLADAIAGCGETIKIQMTATNRPMLISGDEGAFRAVIMPVNLQ